MTLEHVLTYLKSQPDYESDTQTACKILGCSKDRPTEIAKKYPNTLLAWSQDMWAHNKRKRRSFIAVHPHLRQQWNAEKGITK